MIYDDQPQMIEVMGRAMDKASADAERAYGYLPPREFAADGLDAAFAAIDREAVLRRAAWGIEERDRLYGYPFGIRSGYDFAEAALVAAGIIQARTE